MHTGAVVHNADGHMTKPCKVSTDGKVTKTTTDCTASGAGAMQRCVEGDG